MTFKEWKDKFKDRIEDENSIYNMGLTFFSNENEESVTISKTWDCERWGSEEVEDCLIETKKHADLMSRKLSVDLRKYDPILKTNIDAEDESVSLNIEIDARSRPDYDDIIDAIFPYFEED